MLKKKHDPILMLRAAAAASVLCSAVALAQTDISDTPMAVKNNVAPNFMFMVDNSGSMSNVVPEAPYDSKVKYDCPGTVLSDNYQVDIFVESDGDPYFRRGDDGSTYYDWGTDGTKGKTDRNKRCFDPAKTYSARLNGDSGNSSKSPGSYLPADYSGNYLNWYFGVDSNGNYGAQATSFGNGARIKPGQRSRMEIARVATNAALDTLPLSSDGNVRVRTGLSTYNNGNGGTLLVPVSDLTSSALTSLKNSVDDLTASGNTPLSETLADIGQYFSIGYTGSVVIHPDSASNAKVFVNELFKQGSSTPHKLSGVSSSTAAPVQYWCQRSYAILMTDGRPQGDQNLSGNSYLCDYDGDSGNCTTNGSKAYDQKASSHVGHLGGGHTYESQGSDYLDDVAQALYEIDLRPDLEAPAGRSKKNNVRTYTVGFADQQAIDDPLMQEAAAQGGGLFLTANNTSELVTAFKRAIDDALAKDGASAAVAVSNSNITVENTSYASDYNSGSWTGDLKAFALNTSTGLPIMPEIWSAQAKLEARSASSRNIVTYDGSGGGVIFGSGVSGLSAELANYIRGDRSLEGTTFRRRSKLLGDIVDAEPVVVNYGASSVVYQGANDGLLHVFDGSPNASGGEELWAYAPRQLHSMLDEYADPNYAHHYYVDATPAVGEVVWGGATRKILVGGYGKGGKGYYALDITTPTAADQAGYVEKVLWEKLGSDSDAGFSYGRPLIVRTADYPDGVVLVPSGYNNASGRGVLFALDPETGAELFSIDTGVGSATSPAGLAHLAKPGQLGENEQVAFVYGGDLLGNVWRFSLESATRGAVRIAELRDGSGAAQPVSIEPAVGPVPGSAVKNYVYVGTGLYLGDSDIPGNMPQNAHAQQVQSIYGIIDDVTENSPTLPDIRGTNGPTCPSDGGNGDFICQNPGSPTSNSYTNTNFQLAGDSRGWYFDLPVANSRVVTHPQLTSGGTLAVTVNVPTNVKCDPGGQSWFVTVNARNGGAIAKTYGGNDYWPSMVFLGYALGSRPVVITTADGKRGVVRMSDRTFESPAIPEPPGPTGKWRRVYWRDLGSVN